jgi:hypothetical protein
VTDCALNEKLIKIGVKVSRVHQPMVRGCRSDARDIEDLPLRACRNVDSPTLEFSTLG